MAYWYHEDIFSKFTGEERKATVLKKFLDDFQSRVKGPIIGLVSTDKGGVGVTLTGACQMLIMDGDWNDAGWHP